jgi:signal transduction histidine kinase
MHDELGQILTGLDLELRWMLRKHSAVPQAVRERMNGVLELSELAIKTVQRISSELRPGILDHLGLKAAIEWLSDDFSKRLMLIVAAKVEARESLMGERTSLALFRITQEALTNVARHARASSAEVSIRENGGVIELEVRDDGVGITEAQASGPGAFGLMGIRERAHELGGETSIRGEAGKGTCLSVVIPLPPQGELP